MHELVQTDPSATAKSRRASLVQCRYLIDKGIAALIPTGNQSRTIRVPPIKNVAPRESCPTAHEERRRKQPHSDETRNQFGTSTPLRMPPRCPVNATTRTAMKTSAQYPAVRLLLSARFWRARHHASVQIKIPPEVPKTKCKRRFPRSLWPSSCSCHASTPVMTAASAVIAAPIRL